MGQAHTYQCTACGHKAGFVTQDFDCGMSGAVITPIVCSVHGIESGDVGIHALDLSTIDSLPSEFPCEICGRLSPRWDRETCPKCEKPTMELGPDQLMMMWD